MQPTATIATNAGWAALALDRVDVATRWFAEAMGGPRSYASAPAMGECCVGTAAALARSDPRLAAELLGLGHWLLDHEGRRCLPRWRHTTPASPAWSRPHDPHATSTADLVMTGVQQIVGGLDSSAAPEPLTLTPC